MAETLRADSAIREFGLGLRQEVVDVNRLSIDDCSTANRAAVKWLFKTERRLNQAIVGYHPDCISIDKSNYCIV
jgi:hypothetical protein